MFWLLGFCVVVFFCVRKYCSRTLYSFLIIVKSPQLRGRRQIAEPNKYCLVCVIVFFGVCFSFFFFFSFFFVSHRLGIQVNSLHKSPIRRWHLYLTWCTQPFNQINQVSHIYCNRTCVIFLLMVRAKHFPFQMLLQ